MEGGAASIAFGIFETRGGAIRKPHGDKGKSYPAGSTFVLADRSNFRAMPSSMLTNPTPFLKVIDHHGD